MCFFELPGDYLLSPALIGILCISRHRTTPYHALEEKNAPEQFFLRGGSGSVFLDACCKKNF